MAHTHCPTPIPRPIPIPRQNESGLIILFGSVSTGPGLRLRLTDGFCPNLTPISVSIDIHCNLLGTVFGISMDVGVGVG